MEVRLNSPRLQNGPLLWAGVCVVGLAVSVWVVLRHPLGSESWLVGLFLAGQVILSFVAIEGWWLLSQREVVFDERMMMIRRWSDVLLNRAGRSTPISAIRSLDLVIDGGKKIRVECHQAAAITFWAALWPRHEVDRLVKEAEARSISVATQW